MLVKFIYSEKSTKCCEIITLLLSYVVPVKSKVKVSQNFVVFSEYMNIKKWTLQMLISQYLILVLKLSPIYTVSLNRVFLISKNQCYPGTSCSYKYCKVVSIKPSRLRSNNQVLQAIYEREI